MGQQLFQISTKSQKLYYREMEKSGNNKTMGPLFFLEVVQGKQAACEPRGVSYKQILSKTFFKDLLAFEI